MNKVFIILLSVLLAFTAISCNSTSTAFAEDDSAAVSHAEEPVDLRTGDNGLSEKENGYGFFGFGKTARLMHASMILCAYYSPGIIELSSAVIISVLLEIQQQQAAQAAAAA